MSSIYVGGLIILSLFYLNQAFEPIAKIADEIVKRNGFSDKISVIGKRSTELTVGKGKLTCGHMSKSWLLV